MDMKEFPPTEQGLKALVKKPADLSEAKAKRWEGPYTESGELPKDPWGNDFQYEYPPKHATADRSRHLVDGPRRRGWYRRRHRQLEPGRFGREVLRGTVLPGKALRPGAEAALKITAARQVC